MVMDSPVSESRERFTAWVYLDGVQTFWESVECHCAVCYEGASEFEADDTSTCCCVHWLDWLARVDTERPFKDKWGD